MSGFWLSFAMFVVVALAVRLRSRWSRMIQCQHLYAITVYGDAIIAAGFRRGWCPDCNATLTDAPYSASARHEPVRGHRLAIQEAA